jgi:hypothetical protein
MFQSWTSESCEIRKEIFRYGSVDHFEGAFPKDEVTYYVIINNFSRIR